MEECFHTTSANSGHSECFLKADGQQCAQVAIASFAHAQQIRLAPTGVLPWHQSQPRSDFIPTLIPIAAAYNIAHNFSNLLIQGQTVFQLLSDPLGRQCDLFGTAKWYPDIGLVDARLTWYVAVVSIVLGHVLSIWLAHRIALTLRLSTVRTALATAPLTVLMVAFTAISLTVIAEPMVSYTP